MGGGWFYRARKQSQWSVTLDGKHSGNDEKSIWEVNIHRDGKRYGFVTNDSRFLDEEYIIDLLGTVDIR